MNHLFCFNSSLQSSDPNDPWAHAHLFDFDGKSKQSTQQNTNTTTPMGAMGGNKPMGAPKNPAPVIPGMLEFKFT